MTVGLGLAVPSHFFLVAALYQRKVRHGHVKNALKMLYFSYALLIIYHGIIFGGASTNGIKILLEKKILRKITK
jgi:hypothetical protein